MFAFAGATEAVAVEEGTSAAASLRRRLNIGIVFVERFFPLQKKCRLLLVVRCMRTCALLNATSRRLCKYFVCVCCNKNKKTKEEYYIRQVDCVLYERHIVFIGKSSLIIRKQWSAVLALFRTEHPRHPQCEIYTFTLHARRGRVSYRALLCRKKRCCARHQFCALARLIPDIITHYSLIPKIPTREQV